jgi:hypothetical protein
MLDISLKFTDFRDVSIISYLNKFSFPHDQQFALPDIFTIWVKTQGITCRDSVPPRFYLLNNFPKRFDESVAQNCGGGTNYLKLIQAFLTRDRLIGSVTQCTL